MDDERKVTFPGRFDSLAPISEFVGCAAEAAGLDERAVYAVQLAVDEASTNVIEHAYGGEGRGDIEITCRVNSHGLTVTLRDHGSQLDPERLASLNLQATLQERNGGGLGLYLMHQLMDEVGFDSSSDCGNILTMVKRKKAAPRSDTR